MITTQDESTGTYSFYDMVYSVVDGKPYSDVVLIKKKGSYFLLVGSSYLIEMRTPDWHNIRQQEADIELRDNGYVGKVTLSYYEEDYRAQTYMTSEGRERHYSYVLLFPNNTLPSEGLIQIVMKDKVYSFDLTPETHD